MSEPLIGVVVSHGALAQALIDAVQRITGEASGLVPVSNADCSREVLRGRLEQAIGARAALVFVDMPAGSCMQAAVAEVRERADVRVVAGVNLPMLLDFVYHRDADPAAAVQRAVEHGNRAIQSFPR